MTTKDITLVYTTYNRLEYVEQTLPAILQLAHNFGEIHIHDDCSDIGVFDEIVNWLEAYEMPNVTLIRAFKNKGTRQFIINTASMVNTDLMYIHDNDVMPKEGFIEELNKAAEYITKNLSIISLFRPNTEFSPWHKELGEKDGYIEKNVIGGCSFLVPTMTFKHYLDGVKRNGWKHPAWDWGICEFAQSLKFNLLCTKESFVDHIGEKSTKGSRGSYDRSI